MQVRGEMKLVRFVPVTVISAGLLGAAFVTAAAQANPSAAGSSSSIQLQPYTAPDKSASAGVPPGWNVTAGTSTEIRMKGPHGEVIQLGTSFIAHDGPLQAGQPGPSGSFMTMPYSAKLTDKLVMILQQDAAISGKPAPQVQFLSATPLQLPAALGQCGKFVISVTGVPTPSKAMGNFCSLPTDTSGFFKNFLMMGSSTPDVAAQDAPTVQAVFASFKIAPDWMSKKFAPFTPPPMAAAPSGASNAQLQSILRQSQIQQQIIDQGAQCAGFALLNTSNWDTPRACGGRASND